MSHIDTVFDRAMRLLVIMPRDVDRSAERVRNGWDLESSARTAVAQRRWIEKQKKIKGSMHEQD